MVKLVAGAAALVGVVMWLGPDWQQILTQVELDFGYLVVAFIGTLLASVVTAARWKLLHETTTGDRIPYGSYFHYLALTRFVGQFSSTLLMDVIGRGVAIRAAGSQRGLTYLLAPLLLERLLDALLPISMLGWAWLVYHQVWAETHAIALFTFTLVTCVAFALPLLGPTVRLVLAIYARLRRLPPSSDVVVISRRVAAAVGVLSLLRYVTVALQFFGMGAAVGVALPAVELLAALPVAQLGGMIGITPGGLGIQEAGWAGILRWLGHSATTIALFVLASRVLVIANFGILSLASVRWGRRRRSH